MSKSSKICAKLSCLSWYIVRKQLFLLKLTGNPTGEKIASVRFGHSFFFRKNGHSWVASTPHSIMHPYAIRPPIDLLEQKRFLRCLLGQLDWSSYYTRRTFINSYLFSISQKSMPCSVGKRHHLLLCINITIYSETGNSMRA